MGNAFEWDDSKNVANIQKHGVDFESACAAFNDYFGVIDLDTSMVYGELRYRMIARSGNNLLTVIYTERGDRVRIISARQAARRERDRYYRENAQE